jgi:hypothetical protein
VIAREAGPRRRVFFQQVDHLDVTRHYSDRFLHFFPHERIRFYYDFVTREIFDQFFSFAKKLGQESLHVKVMTE